MTIDEILAMVPGTEMDQAVGKTIGATPEIKWYAMNKEENAYCMDFERQYSAEVWHNDMLVRFPDSWYVEDGYHIVRKEIYSRYSEDISKAWGLAVRFKLAIIPQTEAPKGMEFCVRRETGPSGEEITVFAETAMEAICKAVLMIEGDSKCS